MKRPQWTPRLSTGVRVFLMLLLLGMAGCLGTWAGRGGEARRTLADGSRVEGAADGRGNLQRPGIANPKQRADFPAEAAEYFVLKRVPEGESAIPVERYAAAVQHKRRMPQQSTATGTLWPSRLETGLSTEAAAAVLGTWTYLGPGNIGGRTRGLLIDPVTPSTMYAAGVAGGVWKTTNGGQSWTPLMDSMANLAVASLAMDRSNTSVIYAGTGEGVFNIDAVRGAGIFKSTDAGASWQQLASTNTADFYYVNKIVVSPTNGQRVYAATRTGVWRSLDGGSTWSRVLNPGAVNGCLDVAARTDQTTDYVFAACGTFTQATVYRNVDAGGGGTWTAVLTESGMGRTALAIAPSNQAIIYALASSIASGPFRYGLHAVFRSTSSGDSGTWTARVRNSNATKLNTVLLTNPVFAFLQECGFGSSAYYNQGWYDNMIAVDPADANRVWVGGIDLFRSDDGGANWGLASYWWASPNAHYAHADQHAMVFHPQYNGTTNQTLFIGNDGGLFKTTVARAAVATGPTAPCNPNNGSVTWTTLNNGYGVTQFYHGLPYPGGTTYFGGTQDNGTLRGSDSAGPNGWTEILGGDGGYVAVYPSNPNTIYGEYTDLSIQKSTDGGTNFSDAVNGISGDDGFLFIAPFAMDPGNASRLWTGGFYVWRTTNEAANWSRASAAVPDGQVSAIAIHPTNGNNVLVGTSAGYILRTSTGLSNGPTTTWANVRLRSGYVSSLTFHPTDTHIAYATYSTFGGTHVWRSSDGGATWTGIDGAGTTGIPDVPVHSVVVDPSNTSRLYVGTDIGVFSSTDGGATWATENTGFANVITEWLAIGTMNNQAHLFAFTHGRGAWRVALTSAVSAPPITSPAPSSTLTSNTVTFTGGHTSADLQHSLYVGTSSGASNLFNQDLGTGHSASVSGLPNSGTIHVRYWTLFSSGWQFTDQQYTMNVTSTTAPRITSPAPSSTLTSNTVTFTGGHTSADLQHWLYVGTNSGASNLSNQDLGTGHSASVSGLPNSGTIYVRYWTRFASGWQFTDQQYTMNVASTTAAPTATTGAPTNVTSSSATLNGTVNPNGLATTVSFQWGTTTAYGNTTAAQSLGSGTSNQSVSANLSGLSANTTYHYRIVASNSKGTTNGTDGSFTTSSAAPGNLITNGSFSSGSSGWTLSGDFWAGTTLPNYRTAPGHAAGGVNNTGTPKNIANGSMYQTVTIPSTATLATLTFWYNITSEETGPYPFDVLRVTIKNASGTTLATVAVLSNLNKSCLTCYTQRSFNATAYRGQTIRVHFLATTNGSLKTVFRMDDVSLVAQ